MEKVTDETRRQWGPLAQAYLDSPTHARGEDLDTVLALADPHAHEVALDLGCGVGHTLRRIATRVRLAVGADATTGMLEGARTLLAHDGVSNAVLVVAPAESLPFLDSMFDLVTCRLAAHHFADLARAFREVGRVLKAGGRFVLSDNYAPDDESLDRFINTLEVTRDRTHVREHTIAGWRALLEDAGFTVTDESRGTTHIDTEGWLQRSRTPDDAARRVREMLGSASPAARDAFGIDDRGFDLLKVVLRTTRRP